MLRLTKLALNRAYEAMGLRQAVNANLDLSAILNAAETPEQREFDAIVAEQGLKAALAWRDSRYGGALMEVAGTPIPPQLAELLERFRFDRVPFELLRERLLAAGADPESLHRIDEAIEVPAEDIATRLPAPGTPERARLAALGNARHRARGDRRRRARGRHGDALRLAGQGARPRAGRTRAELPRPQARRPDAHGADITLMTSFATHDALAEAVAGIGRPSGAAARVAAAGGRRLALPGRRGRALAARARAWRPGRRAAALRARSSATAQTACARSSCATSTTSARRSIPALAGLHRELGGAITAELVSKRPGDAGGVPVRRADGSLALAEAFRVPEDFPHERFPLFNTNTLWIDIAALEAPGRLHLVRGPQERGRARGDPVRAPRRRAHLVASVALRPRPREGAESRFVPVKDADDLAAAQEQIAAICRERLALTSDTRSFSAVSARYGNGTDRVSESCHGRIVSDHLSVTNLRTLLSLALAALFAVPVAAGAAVTATTISEPVTDPSVLVYVEPAGLTLKVSGTSNGGTGRLDLRCEGAAPAVVDRQRAPDGRGRLDDDALGGRRSAS